ncbi:phenylacetate--CoA ligase family protein [Anaeromassilibacillus sp. An200]|uniref:phenylacetate--CoA ligase family protein n=1 Tax=Anaeromassilibacillus sp. An200 TaxID=1965587 RepID=UPI000B36928A|nr:phenylacetate--CoA ligase [Anaeromassilibacillus sp. An200]OUP13794.1 phenylacetate--CoA ligase [Anaeromassilibacillus sp. An200]
MFFQKEIETMSRPEIEALQLERLKRMVDYCYENIPFYHEKLEKAGVTGDKIKTLSDIQYIPFTTKDDIRDNYPFRMLAQPMKKIVRIHASSGTTGKPTVGAYTKQDLDNWSDQVARVAVAAGATEDDIFQISFGYGLFTGALGLHYGLEKIGATVIPASSGNTAKQLMMFRDFGVTGLVATPSYALYLSEMVRESGYPREAYKLRLGLLGSEGCTEEMRHQIEKNLGIFVTDNYGLTELTGPGVSGECEYRCGLHFAEDAFLPEIIDSATGERKAPGESGELVVTTLLREGMPVLRYRTKDITRLNYEPCRCGRTHVRMDKVTGRTDDMMIIKGVNVFPSQIESVLVSTQGIGPHYQLVVRRQNFMDNLEVKVELVSTELLESYGELKALQRGLHDRLKSVLGLETKVTLVEPKSLERFQGKAKRILDLRNEGSETK